ncbi:MAG: DEAD/DEAH box helicase [Paramuribaculum sp.]|nr:DEAD/DEAH box helicase [Paramuribaculum sp.]
MTSDHLKSMVIDIMGIESLNDMQLRMLDAKDRHIILTSPTGTGKTLAFALKLLERMPRPMHKTEAIVIVPTRELVNQIATVLRRLMRGYKTVELYGGHSTDDEIKSLNPEPEIIVATPGRLLDHLQRGTLSVRSPRILVFDEYDKTLELGFEEDIRKILRRIGISHDIILTSATSLDPLPEYLGLHEPKIISDSDVENPRLRTDIIEVPSHTPDKLDALVNLLHSLPANSKTMIFVNHRESASRVYDRLKKERITAGLYHGELDQQDRAIAIKLFENGTYPILISTDLGARGLDIAGVTDIIHYHIPVGNDVWTHRNGRTARVDAEGTVYVIVSEHDSIPEYIRFDRKFDPQYVSAAPILSPIATLYFSAGKKEKISRGDIAGFLMANTQLLPDEIGKIDVADHYALAAVPRKSTSIVLEKIKNLKIKGKKVKISIIK